MQWRGLMNDVLWNDSEESGDVKSEYEEDEDTDCEVTLIAKGK